MEQAYCYFFKRHLRAFKFYGYDPLNKIQKNLLDSDYIQE